MASAADKLALAQRHLRRVQSAWDDPTDWDDLCLYGFYALEAAVDCACLHFEESTQKTHWSRVDAAHQLRQYGLDDVSDLLRDLNEGRKSVAYGDADLPDRSAEELAAKIEAFIDSVSDLLERGGRPVNQAVLKQSVRRWPTATAFHWLASFLERAEHDPNVLAVIVIGSAARPNVVSDDLDLMVLCRDRKLLREKAPIEVDVRKANVGSVETDIRSRQDVAIWTVRFGLPLLDKDGIWNNITRRWRSRLPLPDPAVALDRAAAAQVRMEKMRAVGDEDACRELAISYRTHLARAALASAGVQPASRPELSSQLRELGETALADDLERALSYRRGAPGMFDGEQGHSRMKRVSTESTT